MATSQLKVSTFDRTLVYVQVEGAVSALDMDITYTPAAAEWDDMFIGATGSLVITAPANYATAALFPDDSTGSASGSIPDISISTLPTAQSGLDLNYTGEVYWKIWCVPHFMRPQNPALDTDIPFILWNAYPVPPVNNLTSIGGSGQDGLTLDLSAPRAFDAIEELEVNLQITSSAPVDISATYLFNFDYGVGTFLFETSIADWIKVQPEQPVIEVWQWMSDVFQGWNNVEQRVSIRRQPRRRIEFKLLLEDDIARQREYDRWYNRLPSSIVIPFYQYSTKITVDSVITDTKIYFDPDRTDVRDGELVVIYRGSTDESFLLRLDEVEADGATLASPLTVDIYARDIVAPAFPSRLDNQTGPQMTSVSGQLSVHAWVTEFRESFDRPESTAVIEEFDSLMVLDRRPLARNSADEIFDTNPSIIDTGSGLHDQRIAWLHSLIAGTRQFTISRRRDPGEMDYWRDFLTALIGMREPFLLPTFRKDLFLAQIPNPGDYLILIEGANYGSQYWPYDTYKRLQFWNSSNEIIYRKVDAVADQPGGTTLLTLDDPLPLSFNWAEDFTISFLNKVRLASDEVRLSHYEMYTILELAVRTTDQ